MSYDEVKSKYNNLNWDLYFKGLGLEDPGDIDVNQPIFFDELNNMITTIPVNDWKVYFQWNLINSTANYLSSEFENQDFDFYGRTMQGSEQMRERWRRVLGSTNRALGMAVGKKFSEKHFPAEAKERMVTLVQNLKTAYGQRIEQLEWMSDETKAKATDKLAAVRVKIGYPDEWRDFTSLEITRESYVTNVLNANRFNREYNLNQIGKPVNKEEWFMTPQTVNAYYAPSLNEICFPAGILQPPFFYIDGDDAINYGAIGAVIGHEMSHGFDDQGKEYDKIGNLTNWWTDEDSERFKERTNVLVEQFDKIIIIDSLHANGQLSLGENIADLGGLTISYTAFKNAQKENPQSDMIDGYSPDQRFYLSWARVWAQNVREKEMIRRTKEDVHSLGINRVNGPIANIPEFHAAFDVKEGNTLYLPEEERASIW
jgi:putative endopeptidase